MDLHVRADSALSTLTQARDAARGGGDALLAPDIVVLPHQIEVRDAAQIHMPVGKMNTVVERKRLGPRRAKTHLVAQAVVQVAALADQLHDQLVAAALQDTIAGPVWILGNLPWPDDAPARCTSAIGRPLIHT